MSFAIEMIGLLEQVEAAIGLPRVRALHLPPASAAGSKGGEFCAVELDDGSIGLSYVLLDDVLARLGSEPRFTALGGADALAVARCFVKADAAERALGLACVNAITHSLFARAGFRPPASSDSLAGLDPAPGERIGMIGLFKPLVRRIADAGARLTVLELRADLAGEHDGVCVTLDPTALADCRQVLSTSTVLLNDTLDKVLAACRSVEVFVMVGPSAGCLPDPLFARGVTAIGGTWVHARDGFVDAFCSGASWSAHADKVVLSAAAYPGFAALLERARAQG